VQPAPAEQDLEDHRIRLLLVEDEFTLRWPAAEYLRDAGYRVIEAVSAGDGIVVLSSGVHVDLVFSDVNLAGEPRGGHTLALWIARHLPQIPVLLTSGDRGAQELIPAGAVRGFLPKPYDLAEVDRRIKEMLAPR
jgi:DNA-binding NtrC family response regulator